MSRSVKVVLLSVCLTVILLSLCSCSSLSLSSNGHTYDAADQTIIPCEICPVYKDANGICTVISDDGFFESGTILNELVKVLDLKVTVAGSVNRIRYYLENWQHMESEQHIDISNHTVSHIKVEETTPYDTILNEYGESKRFFQANFTSPSFTFVTPNNTTNEFGYQVMKEVGFLAARQGTRGYNSIPPKEGTEPGDWYNLKCMGIGDVQTTEERNAWVDYAAEHGVWLIEMWHCISENGDVGYQPISTAKAKEHLSYLAEHAQSGDLWIASFSEAVSYLYQYEYSKVQARLSGNDLISVRISKLRQDLPWDEFNTDLSIRLYLPKNRSSVEVLSGNARIIQPENPESGFVILQAKPGEEIELKCV